MKCLVFLLSLFLFCNFLQGQNTIDSLCNELKKAQNDTTKLNILIELIAVEYDENIWPKYNEQAYQISLRISKSSKPKLKRKGKNGMAEALNNRGYYFMNTGRIAEAIDNYKKSLKFLQELKDKKGQAVVLSNLANIYENQGNIKKALEMYHLTLSIRSKINDDAGMANSLNALGTIYTNLDDTAKGFEMYRKCIALRKKTNDASALATAYNNLAYAIDQTGNPAKAFYYYTQSYKLCMSVGDKRGAAYALNNLATCYSAQGNIDDALTAYTACLKMRREINDQLGITLTLRNLSQFYMKRGNFEQAEKSCLEALQIARKLGFPDNIKDASSTLVDIYKEKNDSKTALEMYEVYIKMRDSINNAETNKASIRSQFKYEYEKKAAADSVRNLQEKKITAAKLKQEQTQRYALYGGLGLTLLFGIFMFNRFRVTRNQKNIIQHQKHEVEWQKELIDEKQKEVLDSIHYAKRIQQALLPSSKIISRALSRLNKNT